MGYMLEIKDIYKTFNAGTINEKRALNGVNLNLNPGDFVTIIGGNGAGKSTTLNAIAGVWGIDKGNIIIDGTDITKLSEHKRALFLGRVFQDPMTGTAATMSIEENMAIAARRGQKRGLGWGVTKKEREHYREALKELDLGLEDRLSSKVGLLSGYCNRCSHLDIMILLIIIIRARPLHTAHYTFRYIQLSLIQTVSILDYPQLIINYHNSSVINVSQLIQTVIDHLL